MLVFHKAEVQINKQCDCNLIKIVNNWDLKTKLSRTIRPLFSFYFQLMGNRSKADNDKHL